MSSKKIKNNAKKPSQEQINKRAFSKMTNAFAAVALMVAGVGFGFATDNLLLVLISFIMGILIAAFNGFTAISISMAPILHKSRHNAWIAYPIYLISLVLVGVAVFGIRGTDDTSSYVILLIDATILFEFTHRFFAKNPDNKNVEKGKNKPNDGKWKLSAYETMAYTLFAILFAYPVAWLILDWNIFLQLITILVATVVVLYLLMVSESFHRVSDSLFMLSFSLVIFVLAALHFIYVDWLAYRLFSFG